MIALAMGAAASPSLSPVAAQSAPATPGPDLWWSGYWAGFWAMFWLAIVVIAIAITAYLIGRSERLGWWWARKSVWHPGKVPVENKPS